MGHGLFILVVVCDLWSHETIGCFYFLFGCDRVF